MTKTLEIGALRPLLALLALLAIAAAAAGQPGIVAPTSEWESTAFNNGRRMVRDSNGYFHAVWHTSATLPTSPGQPGCDIYYARTMAPAAEPPSMASAGSWSPAINMTIPLFNLDNRYPSIAIEYDARSNYQTINNLHVVWQAIPDLGTRYEVYHAVIPTTGVAPVLPSPWTSAQNLSQTTGTDSLVPSITVNQFGPGPLNQHIHVAWQEEDINNNGGLIPPPQEDLWFSDIAYIRSTDSGLTWAGPAGGWGGNQWDNVTQTAANSQMPSISAILDQYTTTPAQFGIGDLEYNSQAVHMAYNEDVSTTGVNVFYIRSGNDGVSWAAPVNVSAATFSPLPGQDAYPSIAVDMLDNAHVAFMRSNIALAEPLRSGAPPLQYQPGANPTMAMSFPGPHIGMYGALANMIMYAWNAPVGPPWPLEQRADAADNEFPTVSLDRWQHVNLNWQAFQSPAPPVNYEIYRATCINQTTPTYPLVVQNYTAFGGAINDSLDPVNDDYFPNLAHRKTAEVFSPAEPLVPGYDEVWTKITGVGATDAMLATAKSVMQDGNMSNDVAIPVRLSAFQLD